MEGIAPGKVKNIFLDIYEKPFVNNTGLTLYVIRQIIVWLSQIYSTFMENLPFLLKSEHLL